MPDQSKTVPSPTASDDIVWGVRPVEPGPYAAEVDYWRRSERRTTAFDALRRAHARDMGRAA